MSETMYKIVFRGKLAIGMSTEDVAANLKEHFKFSDAALARLFSGRAMVPKSNLGDAEAQRYARALGDAGACCKVEEMEAPAPFWNWRRRLHQGPRNPRPLSWGRPWSVPSVGRIRPKARPVSAVGWWSPSSISGRMELGPAKGWKRGGGARCREKEGGRDAYGEYASASG